MDATRWRRIEELFHAALDEPPADRARYLSRACGEDEALLAAVAELIEADRDASRVITPVSPSLRARALDGVRGTAATAGPFAEGARVGPWRIVKEIGRGGMGAVYLGERADGDFEQTVAIKVLASSSGEQSILERFKSERATLARLNHPNIARLVDGGATENGLPYIAMEHVDGSPIDVHCDRERLSVEARIALFRTVCGAVTYAHQNLVVHRDIKPSNVLVDSFGAPKLLDFGIAKVLAPDDAGESSASSAVTVASLRAMTPEYASPEQVRGEPITTATDVYSLGVVLYELLSGRRPHASPTALPHEIARAVCEDDPDPPSTTTRRRHDPHAHSTREIALARATHPKRLSRLLAGDLDTIVLRAMHKEPARRYGSVAELSDDLGRHLAGLPIHAHKDNLAYRANKLVRRHRLASATAALVLVVLAVAVVSIVRSERVARARLDEVLRLSDLSRLADLSAEEATLWPAVPANVSALESWLARARGLAARVELHRANLDAVRARALPYDDEARARDRASHPDAARLATLRVQRDAARTLREQRSGETGPFDEQIARFDRDIADLASAAEPGRLSWSFGDVETQWQHDKLAELVAKLSAFAAPESGRIADVERRLAFARTVHARSIDDRADAWKRAIASIADRSECPIYEGLAIAPQLGLVPLGRDPDSGLWEFAHLETGRVPERDAAGHMTVSNDMALVFVLVPRGTFAMGARPPREGEAIGEPNVDPLARPEEAPVHQVALDAFFLSKYEMTQGQWLAFTGENPSLNGPGQLHGTHVHDLRHPVEQVSHDECVRVLARLGLCLPTEAQWEYAARGGTTTPWSTGAERDSLMGSANLADRSVVRAGAPFPAAKEWPELDDGYVVHAPVGSFRANPFGLHDVHGNVWEWCRDDFASYAVAVRPGDGERAMKGSDRRIGRGGSYIESAFAVRSSHRGGAAPAIHDKNIGVRPARAIDP